MAKNDKKSKSKSKSKRVFADIQIADVAEVFGGIQALSPQTGNETAAGSPVPIELTGFVGTTATASTFCSFLIRIDAVPAEGGDPVAIAQNVTILQPGNCTQFKLATFHFQPPAGRYHLKAILQTQGSSPIVIDTRESNYDVV